jgi:hypothetical protein
MTKEDQVGRRGYIKTTTLASLAATLPAASLFSQEVASDATLRMNVNIIGPSNPSAPEA